MGPRPFDRGGWSTPTPSTRPSRPPQWGHGPSTVEGWHLPVLPVPGEGAAMGPRPFDRGGIEMFRNAPGGTQLVPQWGHGPSTVEGRRGGRGAQRGPAAGRGPRAFARGGRRAAGGRRQGGVWGLRLLLRDGRIGPQWGHGPSTVEGVAPELAADMGLEAAMGPRPFDRGGSSVSEGVHRAAQAAMGPRPFDRGGLARAARA